MYGPSTFTYERAKSLPLFAFFDHGADVCDDCLFVPGDFRFAFFIRFHFLFRLLQHFLRTLLWNDDDAIDIADNDIARIDRCAAARDWYVRFARPILAAG